jgi:hypothetical protein
MQNIKMFPVSNMSHYLNMREEDSNTVKNQWAVIRSQATASTQLPN